MIAGVYKITNTVNGKRYIGSSVNLELRKKEHFNRLQFGSHPNRHLQGAWNLYGEAAFTFSAVLICEPKDCVFYEQRFLDLFNPEYNLSPTAGSNFGIKFSSEACENMGKARRGEKNSMFGRTGEKNPMFGRTGVRAPMFGKTGSACPNFGLTRSDETRDKIRIAKTGKHYPKLSGKNNGMFGKTGEKNPMFGKQRPDLIKFNQQRTGEKNHNFGKSLPLVVRKKIGKKNSIAVSAYWASSEGIARRKQQSIAMIKQWADKRKNKESS